jgi:hypothetical protein
MVGRAVTTMEALPSTRKRTRTESCDLLTAELNAMADEFQSIRLAISRLVLHDTITADVPTLDYVRVEVHNARERLRAAWSQIDTPQWGERGNA